MINKLTLTALAVLLPITHPGRLCAAAPAPDRPNMILILADDVGLGDIGCFGGPFRTPRIDSLAAGGLRFDRAYVTPLCGPTRAELLTGRYPFRTGLKNNQSHNAIQPAREVMIPTVMKQAGYVTASVGKWGQICLGPGEWGFDEYLVFKGSGRFWASQGGEYVVNGQKRQLKEHQYMPDVMHTFLTEFLEKHQAQPFFAYYPLSSIHGPILRTPDSQPGAGPAALYRDNVEYMDKLVGRLLDELDRLKLREKTLVLFVGDNGTAHFGVEAATVHGKAISGNKGTMLEGGAHVPMLASWPGTTPAGVVNTDLVDATDFLATLVELGGATRPAGVTLDGRSFAAALRGEKGTPRDWVYVELNGKSYVRDARWKLTNHGELFDLADAPYREIAVARDTGDTEAVAARARLQEVLDTHPAAAGDELKPKQQKARRDRPVKQPR